MKTIDRTIQSFLAGILFMFAFVPMGISAEQKGPELQNATYFGGAGDQGGAQDGMGMVVQGKHLYLSGADLFLYGGQALVASYTDPPTASPVFAFRWPNAKGAGGWNEETFPGIAVTHEGIYCAGRSWSQTTDGVGDKEGKAVLVKFPLNGPTGPAVGGALWVAKPHFFPYAGNETFMNVTSAVEGGQIFLYATGRGQYDGTNNTAVLAKFDAQGKILWTKVLGDSTPYYKWSQGDSVVALNGYIYVVGYTHCPTNSPSIRPHVGLWKVGPSGNVVWHKTSPQAILQNSIFPISCVASGNSLYVAAAQEKAPNGGTDVLVLQYNESGTLLSSWIWGGPKDDVPCGMTMTESRLYVVGYTTGWMGGGKDAFLMEMDAQTGKVLSVNYHGGTYDDIAYAVKVSGTDLYVVGDSKSSPAAGNTPGQSDLMLLRYLLPSGILKVAIDIKPGSLPNPINLKSEGKIPVAILSTKEFNAPVLVDKGSLTFGQSGDEKSLVSGMVKAEDVNGDGLLDLVAHFDNPLADFQLGDIQGVLKGKTLSGQFFFGIDSVEIVPPKLKQSEELPRLRMPREGRPIVSPPVPRNRRVTKPSSETQAVGQLGRGQVTR